ncbi:MAG: transcriptional regulator, partial [Anaerolineaceae bacterium]|nr:transcriptional regulator [Anaerolineaceae bacterium]
AFAEDSCNEEAHRIAMRVHGARGNRAMVIKQYEQCSQILEDELGVIPSNLTHKLYESLIQ